MRIFFFTSKLNFRTAGGSVEEFDLMIRTLQGLGNEIACVTTFPDGNDIPTPPPYRVIEENISRRSLFGLQQGIYGLLTKYEKDADFFHVDGHLFLYGAGAYRRLGGNVPVSAYFNRELGSFAEDASPLLASEQRSFYRRIRKRARWLLERTLGMWLARAIDLASFITPLYQKMYEDFGLRNRASMVLADPVDFRRIMRENDIDEFSYRHRLAAGGLLRIFFSSRMIPGKGFDLLLAGFAQVRNKERFRLVLGGNGPEEPALRNLAGNLGITRYVEFLGWMPKEHLYQEFKKADMFVQVGWRREGASMTLLHAMAFGIPCIVPKDSGMAWQAGAAALSVKNGNHSELARAIERLAEDTSLRARLSEACYRRIADDEIDHTKVLARWFDKMRSIRSGVSI
jgi:glycosyltransferase involved in cell wall biosynthesis